MRWMAHDAVIVTAWPDRMHNDSFFGGPAPDVAAFRESLPEEWQPLVIGPVQHVINGDVTYAFLPDGSKEGWDLSDEGDRYRQQFMDLFSRTYDDGSSPYDVVHVRFGGDHGSEVGAQIAYANDRHHREQAEPLNAADLYGP